MRKLICLLALAAAFVLPPALHAQPAPANGQESAESRIRNISQRLHPITGDIRIAQANAVLHLGQDYYFLPAAEARIVLTEAWDNPPEIARNVLGMVFPAGRTFADDTWGAVITYEASGYVNDTDAASVNYDELLVTLRGDEAAINAERARQGFPATHLVGWAQQPLYDPRAHSVVWAQNVQFAGQGENSLNYDVRLLGRRGVLSLNMVTIMSKLAETREAARRLAAAAEFNAGERYADYRPGDQVAEYGIAGLIAAGVGATVAKKMGLIAIILAFGKKAIIFIIAGIALFWRRIRRLFGGGDEEEEALYYESSGEPEPEPEPEGEAPPDADAPPPASSQL